MIDYKAFVAKYYSSSSDVKKRDVERFLAHVERLASFQENAKTRRVLKSLPELLTDKRFLCKTFFMQKTNAVSRSHYQKIKNYLLNLFDYLDVCSVVPSQEKVADSREIVYFFKDLDDVFGFVDLVGFAKMDNYDPSEDLIFIKAIAILAWYGFSMQEIVDVRKSDLIAIDGAYGVYLSTSEDTETANSSDKKLIPMTKQAFDILSFCSSLEMYRSFPSGKVQVLKGDPHLLFRPAYVDCDELKKEYPIYLMKYFNNAAADVSDKILSIKNLRKSALFETIREDKTDRSLIEKIMGYTKCPINHAYAYRKQYSRWAELFYKDN
jgi:hypothetical protein